MATGGKTQESPGEQYLCTPCSVEKKYVKCENYCDQCHAYLCETCLQQHNRFTEMQTHVLQDKTSIASNIRKLPDSPDTEMCSCHHNKQLDMFCGQHNCVCCCACIAIDHRCCKGVNFLPIVAKDVRNSEEFTRVNTNMITIRNELDNLRKVRDNNNQRIGKEKADIEAMVKSFRVKMNKLLDDFEKTTLEQLEADHDKLASKIKKDVEQLEAMINLLQTKLTYLKADQGINDSQLFVAIKSDKNIINEAKRFINSLKETDVIESMELNFNGNIDNFCKEVVSNWYAFSKCLSYKEANVKIKGDTKNCDIFGSCQLENGQILITDANNRKLKRLNELYEVVDYLKLPSTPWAVCSVGPGEVAISLEMEKKIEFIAIGDDHICLINSIYVGMKCRGLASSKGELYVSCGDGKIEGPGQIRVYDKYQKLIRTLQNNSGKPVFSWPQHLAISPDGAHLYVADAEKGIVVVNNQGHVVSRIQNQCPTGVIVNNKNEMFACSSPSHAIHQLGKHGNMMGLLLEKSDGITWPRSLCYDRVNSRLLVTMWSDKIKIYDLA